MKLYLTLCVILVASCTISRAQNVPGLSAWQAALAAHAEAERRAGAGDNPAAVNVAAALPQPVQVAAGQDTRFAAHDSALQLHAQQLQQLTPSGAVPGISAHAQALQSVQEAERRLGSEGPISAHAQALQSVQEAERRLGGERAISAHAQAMKNVQEAQSVDRTISSSSPGGLKVNPENVKRIQNSLTKLIASALSGGSKAVRGPNRSISDVLSAVIKKRPASPKVASKKIEKDRSIDEILASLGIGKKSLSRFAIKPKPTPTPKVTNKITKKDRSIGEILASLGIGKKSSSKSVIKPKKEERTVEELTRTISDKLRGRKTTNRFSGGSSRFSSKSPRFTSDSSRLSSGSSRFSSESPRFTSDSSRHSSGSSRFIKTQSRKVEEGGTYLDRLLAELREQEESTTKREPLDFLFKEDTRSSNKGLSSFLDDIEPAKDELSSLLEKSRDLRKGLRTNIDKAVEDSNEINELLSSLRSLSPRKVYGTNKNILLDIVPQIDENEVDIEGGIGGDLLKEIFSAVPDGTFEDILNKELLKAAKEGSATTQHSLEREIRVASSETEKLSAELDQILKELEGLTENKINLVEESFDDLSVKLRDRQANSKYKDLLEDEEFVSSVLERFAKLGIPLRQADIDLNKIEDIKTTITRSIENAAEESRRLGEELQKQLELLEGERNEGREKAQGLDIISEEIESLLSIL